MIIAHNTRKEGCSAGRNSATMSPTCAVDTLCIPLLLSTMFQFLSRWAQRNLDRLMNFYPPYLGAGIHVTEMDEDMRHIRVEMPLRFYNRNYVGTHYGGSLYSMCDPFYMLMLLHNLGSDYIVWDRKASIEFKKPGRTRVSAEFELTQHRIDEIRKAADEQGKTQPDFEIEIVDAAGDVVAVVDKVVYVRRKKR